MDELLTDPTALETSGQAAGDFVKNSVGATDQIHLSHPYSIAISKESGHTITRIANPALSINGYGFGMR